MKIEKIIFNLLHEKIKNIPYDADALLKGITHYAQDNKLERFAKGMNNEDIVIDLVRAFLKPILNLPPESLVDYFEYYSTYREMVCVSSELLNMAKKAYDKRALEGDVETLEKRLMEISVELYKAPTLKAKVDMMLSEGMLNIAFIKGTSDKMSLALSRIVNINR